MRESRTIPTQKSVKAMGRTGDVDVNYAVTECPNRTFAGAELVAAFFDVCSTFYWTEKKWVMDVSMYTEAIPPTIMML